MSLEFFLSSLLLGAGLAMDAFTVSLANGLHEPQMRRGRMACIAGVFAGFQFLMPMIGWVCVHTVLLYFQAFEKWIPWIALLLLGYIGGKMLIEGIRGDDSAETETAAVSVGGLLLQGIATSIDALSVGFTTAEYAAPMAFVSALIIGIVTFAICTAGLAVGKKAGLKLAGKATILGGLLLIGIGIEIFVSHVFFS